MNQSLSIQKSMKKISTILLGGLIALTASAQTEKTFTYCGYNDPTASDPNSKDLIEYRVLDEANKTCEAIGGPKWDGEGFGSLIGEYITSELRVPQTVKDEQGTEYTVTAIGKNFIQLYDYVRWIYLPATITEIGVNAFYGCTDLISISMHDGLKSIGNSAFAQCKTIKRMDIPETVTSIGTNTFFQCDALEKVVLPAGVTTIPKRAFYNCPVLADIELGNIETFEEEAFANCPRLLRGKEIGSTTVRYKTVEFSPNLKKIGPAAFAGSDSGNPNLVVTLETPPEICDDSFSSWGGIDLYVPAVAEATYKAHPVWSKFSIYRISETGSEFTYEGFRYTVTGSTKARCLGPEAGTTVAGSLVMPEVAYDEKGVSYTVTAIGDNCFKDCKELVSIQLPATIKSINAHAFSGCSALKDINFPEGLTEIRLEAFMGCTSLADIALPNSLEEIQYDAFNGCVAMKSIIIPPKVITINNYAFEGCTGIVRYAIPNRKYDCTIVADEFVSYDPNNVAIEDGFVYNADKTKILFAPLDLEGEFSVPETITSIGRIAFIRCDKITALKMPGALKEIGRQAFKQCTGLKSIEFGPSLTTIDDEAFRGCTALSSVEIVDGITELGYGVFKECTSLASVKLNNVITEIPGALFMECTGLKSIELPSQTTAIGNDAFYNCTALASVNIPQGVKTIGDDAFYRCESLTAITIPESVESIGKLAFSHCSGLTNVEIPASITSINEFTFSSCSALESVTIPESVISIGNSAFNECAQLSSIQFPASLQSVGSNVVSGCNRLESITSLAATPPTADSGSFTAKNYDVPLFVPAEYVDTYKKAPHWKNFKVYAIGDEVSDIPVMDIEGIPALSDNAPTAKLSARLPLVWTSDNENVATVTKKGIVTAINPGEANISAAVYGHPELTDTRHILVIRNITSGSLDIRSEKMSVSVNPGVIIVENVAEGETISLFTADGVMQASLKSLGKPVEFPVMAGKVYIVVANGLSLKVVSR